MTALILALTFSGLVRVEQPQVVREATVSPYRVEFEDNQLRVQRVSIGPRERTAAADRLAGVMIFLTADLEGRMPSAEVEWQPAGTRTLENRATSRFEAIIVEFKDAPSPGSGTPPELAPSVPERVQAKRLLENDTLVVSRHRLAPAATGELIHFHLREAVVVYLNGGRTAGTTGRTLPRSVSRGQVDIVPAYTPHSFWNAGSDSIDFIAVFPK